MMNKQKWIIGLWGIMSALMGFSESTSISVGNISLDSHDYTLAISSDHGAPLPTVGTHVYAWHSSVTCSVDQVVSEGEINWVCSGWTGAGSVPVSGINHSIDQIILTTTASSITWNWDRDLDGDGVIDEQDLDDDNDGMSDANEAIAGTSSLDPESILKVELVHSNATYSLSWFGVTGRYYRVEQTDQLESSWSPEGAVITGENLLHEVDLDAIYPRFYRVRVSESPDEL